MVLDFSPVNERKRIVALRLRPLAEAELRGSNLLDCRVIFLSKNDAI